MLKIFLILVMAGSILFMSNAFGQQLSMGATPKEDIVVTIDENGDAHVVHQVQVNHNTPVQVDMIAGNMTNFSVTDENGSSVQYSTISQKPMAVLLLPSDRNMTMISYDLIHAVTLNNGIWYWKYYEPPDATYTDFHFPKGVNMIWSNNQDDPATARPVYLANHGLRQVGNGFFLAYVINEPVTVQTLQSQGKTFYVDVQTLANVGSPVFDQSGMTYGFNVDQPNSFVTVIMPKELLGGKYQATINTNKILTNEFHDNDTYAWIGIRPDQSGTVQITGSSVFTSGPVTITGIPPTNISPENNITIYIGIAIAVAAAGAGIAIMLHRKSKISKASST